MTEYTPDDLGTYLESLSLEEILKAKETEWDKKEQLVKKMVRIPASFDRTIKYISKKTGVPVSKCYRKTIKHGISILYPEIKKSNIEKYTKYLKDLYFATLDFSLIRVMETNTIRSVDETERRLKTLYLYWHSVGALEDMSYNIEVSTSECIRLCISASLSRSESVLSKTTKKFYEQNVAEFQYSLFEKVRSLSKKLESFVSSDLEKHIVREPFIFEDLEEIFKKMEKEWKEEYGKIEGEWSRLKMKFSK